MQTLLRRTLDLILVCALLAAPLQAAAAIGPSAATVAPPDSLQASSLERSALPHPSGSVPDAHAAQQALQGAPLLFIENIGQFDARARFQVRGGGGMLWLADDALWLTLVEPAPQADPRGEGFAADVQQALDAAGSAEPRQGVNIRLSFDGANPSPRIEPFARSATKVSYFHGNDPEGWHADVPVWGGVRYVDLYPGLDLEITGEAGRWAWRMVATDDAATLDAVQLRVEGAVALDTLDGLLALDTAVGALALPLLEAVTADGQPLAARAPRSDGAVVAAPFGATSAPDGPVASQSDGLVYSTFLGGSGADQGHAITVDGQGRAHVTGSTESTDFPTTPGAYDTTHNGGWDAFVTVLSPTGTGLVYSTFLGGSGNDYGRGIAVDGQGQTYVTGSTESTDFPTTPGAYDTTHNGRRDAFVTVLNPTGTGLVYSTFLGGSGNDYGRGIAVDEHGRAYTTGETHSRDDYPTTPGAYDTTHNGQADMYSDAFVTVLNPTGTGLVYSTFLGGSREDRGYGIAVDTLGRAYVAGSTRSRGYPTTPGAYQTTRPTALASAAFVTVLSPTGTGLVYSTFLGGMEDDQGRGNAGRAIAVDGEWRAYVTGLTYSSNFPTTSGAYDTTYNGDSDVFVTVLNPTGTGLVYSTFLGGSREDRGKGIAVDGQGQAYITGWTESSNLPTTPGAYDTTRNGDRDAFVSVLNSTGTALVYSTFLGGSDRDRAWDIGVDGQGRAYVTGVTCSSDFSTTSGAYDTTYNDGCDGYVTVLEVGDSEPGHSISGHITDAAGAGLPGVLVSASGRTALTGADGAYTITGLSAGAHTVTPTLAGYSFSPAWRTVSVPPAATGVSFYGWAVSAVADPAQSSVIVEPAFVQADGQDAGVVTVTLRNASGDPVPGKRVEIVSSRGPRDAIVQPSALTNTQGQAFGSIVSTVPGIAMVTATDVTDNVQVHQQASVEFTCDDETVAPWLLMYYLAWDNNLDRAMTYEYGSLHRAATNPKIRVALFHDGRYGEARHIVVHPDGTRDVEWLGELNTGDPQTLGAFLQWAKSRFPEHRYALIISNHGHALSGIAEDWSAGEDSLSPGELQSALQSVGGVNVLWAYACLMGNLDVAFQLRGLADYYVAHESIGWAGGSPSLRHEDYAHGITAETTPEQLAVAMAQAYYQHLTKDRPEDQIPPSTVSVVRLSHVETVAQSAFSMAAAIRGLWSTIATDVWDVSDASILQRFDESDPIGGEIGNEDRLADLYHFAELVSGLSQPELQSAAQDLMAALDDYIVYNRAWSNPDYSNDGIVYSWDHSNAYGVSVHLPRNRTHFYVGDWIDFAAGADWAQLESTASLQANEGAWGPLIVDLVSQFAPDSRVDAVPPELVPMRSPWELIYLYLPLVMR